MTTFDTLKVLITEIKVKKDLNSILFCGVDLFSY